MDVECLTDLLDPMRNQLFKEDFNESVTARERLIVKLHSLATGSCYEDVKFSVVTNIMRTVIYHRLEK